LTSWAWIAGIAAFAAVAAYVAWRVFLRGQRVGEVTCWRDSVTPTRQSVRFVVSREEDRSGVRVLLRVSVPLAASSLELSAKQALAFAELLEKAAAR
jgi:hypothetical protein